MPPRLFIVNNGLRDLCGHYYETSVAIAEAAARAGLRPILAAHVTCPPHLAPAWLDFRPAFSTDHWQLQPPPRAEAVPAPPHRPPGRLARAKALARGLLPPVVATPLRWAYRQRGKIVPGAKKVLKSLTPPLLWDRLRAKPQAAESNHRDELDRDLASTGPTHEYDSMLVFRADLERLLADEGCTPADHVFLPTAHSRELVAIARWIADVGERNAPTFHLEFRHATFISAGPHDPLAEHIYCTRLRVFFDHYRRGPQSERIRLYTDTEELADDYRDFSGLTFSVLPIPFRAGLIRPRTRKANEPLCVAYFGDVRDEKGFYHLGPLAAALLTDGPPLRFLVQATLNHPEWNRQSAETLRWLEAYPPSRVTLVGRDGPLSAEDYYAMVSAADVVVCPYEAGPYRSRSSGTLAEAIAAGLPTVAPRGTWLARQQPPGAGEAFDDGPSFVAAVRRICDDYDRYRAHALAHRGAWLDRHSPERLVAALLHGGSQGVVARGAA